MRPRKRIYDSETRKWLMRDRWQRDESWTTGSQGSRQRKGMDTRVEATQEQLPDADAFSPAPATARKRHGCRVEATQEQLPDAGVRATQEQCRSAVEKPGHGLTDLAGAARQAPRGVASLYSGYPALRRRAQLRRSRRSCGAVVTFLWPRREKSLGHRRWTKRSCSPLHETLASSARNDVAARREPQIRTHEQEHRPRAGSYDGALNARAAAAAAPSSRRAPRRRRYPLKRRRSARWRAGPRR